MSLMDPPPHDPRHDQYQILGEAPVAPAIFIHSLDRPTLRAILAGMVLQGILVNPSSMISRDKLAETAKFDGVECAVNMADALLKRLEE